MPLIALTTTEIVPFLGLIGVVLGAVLSNGTSWIKEVWRRRQLIRALYVELADARRWVLRSKLSIEQIIREMACGGMSDFVPMTTPMQIYDRHIAELAFYLRESERISFHAIRGLIAQVEKQHAGLAELRAKAKPDDPAGSQQYVQLVHASYSNVCLLACHIAFHLEFRRKVNTDAVTTDDAKKVVDDTRTKMETLIREAKKLGLEAVKENHYREVFPVKDETG